MAEEQEMREINRERERIERERLDTELLGRRRQRLGEKPENERRNSSQMGLRELFNRD